MMKINTITFASPAGPTLSTRRSRVLLLAVLCFAASLLRAQVCGGCTVSINTHNLQSYTVSAGQVFCIGIGGRFEGSLVLNGGSICNQGIFNPASFSMSTGTVTNYGLIRLCNTVTLPQGVVFSNISKSAAAFTGDLKITGGIFSNAGMTSVKDSLIFNSGSLSNTDILSYKTLSGSAAAAISNTGILNKN